MKRYQTYLVMDAKFLPDWPQMYDGCYILKVGGGEEGVWDFILNMWVDASKSILNVWIGGGGHG